MLAMACDRAGPARFIEWGAAFVRHQKIEEEHSWYVYDALYVILSPCRGYIFKAPKSISTKV